ncbi:MAG: hypothetical protein QMD77_00050 [Patescibacteria group bacterium]|nr:hypothetical protein [Patescibacteria group bacterium]
MIKAIINIKSADEAKNFIEGAKLAVSSNRIAKSVLSTTVAKELKKVGVADNEIPALASKLKSVRDPKVVFEELAGKASAPAFPQSTIHPSAGTGKTASALEKTLPQETPRLTDQDILKSPSYKKDSTLSQLKQSNDYKSIFEADKNLIPGEVNPSKVGIFKQAKKAVFGEWWTKTRETVQDNWIRVKNLQREPGVKVSKDLNPYDAETLFHGRVGRRLELAQEAVKEVDMDVLKTAKSVGVKDKELYADVNKYLIATHAPERNAKLGTKAAGMTDDEAANTLMEIGVKKHAGEIKRIADKVKEVHSNTLNILRDSEVISDELYETLKKAYKNHVPLNRLFEETEDVGQALTSKGFSTKGTGIKRAKGSEREVADIMTNVTANLEQAIVRAEKNRVNLATLKFARDNADLGIFKEVKPKAIGKTFDDKVILAEVRDPLTLAIREKGKPIYLRIEDEKLAKVFQGVGNDKLPGVFKFVGSFTRLYAGLATRFNPEFVLSNKLRDIQEMAVYMSAQKDVGFSGAEKTVGRDAASMLDVVRNSKLYQQMQLDGGTTGGMALSTRKNLELNIEKIQKLNRSSAKKTAQYILGKIDGWNTVFEDSTRLSVYKTALEKGMGRNQAAKLAKEATVNFNKKGTGGQIINSLYMFSNASIQGSTKMLKAMKNPKVAAATITSVAVPVFAVNKWNDSVDENWRDKVDKWDRTNNLIVMYKSDKGATYFKIPVSWGIKPIKVAADYASDAYAGKNKDGALGTTKGIIASALDAYNPAGGTDIPSSVTPTILDTPSEIWRNKKWTGSPMRPEDKEGVPRSEQFFQNKQGEPSDKSKTFGLFRGAAGVISKKTGGEIEISPADAKYAYDQLIGGAGRTISKTMETVSAIAKGELPQPKETPFVSRFVTSKTEEELQKADTRDEKAALFEVLKKASPEDRKTRMQEYIKNLPNDDERGKMKYIFQQEGLDTKGISTSGDIIDIKPTFEKVQKLLAEGKDGEAQVIVDNLSDDDYEKYKKAKSSDQRRKTEEARPAMEETVKNVQELLKQGKDGEAQTIVNDMTDSEYKQYKSIKKKLGFEE